MAERTKSQNALALIVGICAVGVAAVMYAVLGAGGREGPQRERQPIVGTEVLENVRQSAAPEAAWVRTSENRLREIDQEIERLVKTNEALRAQIDANVKSEKEIVAEIGENVTTIVAGLSQRLEAAEERAAVAEADRVRLAAELERAADRIENASVDEPVTGQQPVRRASFSPAQGENEFVSANDRARRASGGPAPDQATPTVPGPVAAPQPASVEFQLEGVKNGRKRLDRYLPAGSYAQAVVLSGVDASAGVQNSADPRPVLLRITGPAVTAAVSDGSPQTIDITGCVLTAEAVGDLSSERVFPRLISMTCSPEEGAITEMAVAGFVAGQGKAGVRGRVVSREGDLVENAAIAGALSGLSGVISDIGSTASGDVTSDEDLQGLNTIIGRGLLDAGGQGAGAAFDRLAQYYIERAEQYQPVISLYGGTPVEVVFLKGVMIDG